MNSTGLRRVGGGLLAPGAGDAKSEPARRSTAPLFRGALVEGLVLLARPGVFRSWLGFVYAALVSAALALLAAAGPLTLEVQRAGLLSEPGAVALILGRLQPWAPLLLLLAVVLYGVFAAAVERAALSPQERAFGYLRLGETELRRMLCALTSVSLMAGAAVLALLAGAAIEAVAAVLVYALTGDASAEPIFTSSAVLLPLLAVGALAVVGARLSLSPSIAFVSGRINPRLSWRLTRGHTLALIRLRLLGLGGALVVLGAALLIGLAPSPATGGGAAALLSALRVGVTGLLWPAAALAAAAGELAIGPALWLRLGSGRRERRGD